MARSGVRKELRVSRSYTKQVDPCKRSVKKTQRLYMDV
jgi:hypothetical protein